MIDELDVKVRSVVGVVFCFSAMFPSRRKRKGSSPVGPVLRRLSAVAVASSCNFEQVYAAQPDVQELLRSSTPTTMDENAELQQPPFIPDGLLWKVC